jgi:hypothetical protein
MPPRSQDTPFVAEQVPEDEVTETNMADDGMSAVSEALVEADGPRFVTVAV